MLLRGRPICFCTAYLFLGRTGWWADDCPRLSGQWQTPSAFRSVEIIVARVPPLGESPDRMARGSYRLEDIPQCLRVQCFSALRLKHTFGLCTSSRILPFSSFAVHDLTDALAGLSSPFLLAHGEGAARATITHSNLGLAASSCYYTYEGNLTQCEVGLYCALRRRWGALGHSDLDAPESCPAPSGPSCPSSSWWASI